jgi:hypothetical protein
MQFPLSEPETVFAPGPSVPTDGPEGKLNPPGKSVVSVKSIANAETAAVRQTSIPRMRDAVFSGPLNQSARKTVFIRVSSPSCDFVVITELLELDVIG